MLIPSNDTPAWPAECRPLFIFNILVAIFDCMMSVMSIREKWVKCVMIAVAILAIVNASLVPVAQSASHWPASISGPNGFQDLGRAITKDPGFPAKGTDVEKARFVYSRLPDIARKYEIKAATEGVLDQYVIMKGYRWINPDWARSWNPLEDPEGAKSLKGWCGKGNCGEWSYAFSEILGGAGVVSRVVYGDKAGGEGHTGGFTGTDTTVIVEERTPDGKVSRRVFDAFRAAYHSSTQQPDSATIAQWGDRPLTDDDKLLRDIKDGKNSWQSTVRKPVIKDASSQKDLGGVPPRQKPDPAGEERREKEKKEKEAAQAAAEREAEEYRKRQKALQEALKQAEALIGAARAAAGRAQAALAVAKGVGAAGATATSAASAAQGAVQQAKGAVGAARSACAKVVSAGVIDSARARAEAAAGEVGSLYQEAVDLAKEACQAAGRVQKASNADARRILTTKTEALAARSQSRATSAQVSAARARAEAARAVQQNANRQAAIEANAAARAAIAAARGQISVAEGAMQSHEATVGSAQGQLGAARTAIDEVERNKTAARGVLGPFLSESEVQMMLPVINGVVAPPLEGIDQPVQQALSAIQQARVVLMTAREQLTGWEGGLGACGALAPTDDLVQAAQAAASAAELFLPRISAAAGQASQCAGLSGSGTPGLPADVKGATEAGGQFQGQTPGGRPPGPTSGAAGGGQPIEQPGLKPPPGAEPPTAGAGGPVGPGPGQGVWCYSEKTQEQYWFPYGPCPPPHMKPPSVGGPLHDPRVPWQELVPPSAGGGGPKPSTHPKPACGPTTVCTCPGGKVGHIPCDKSKGSCHCGGN